MFVVTGGGSGIGRYLARALAEHGKEVLIIGRQPATLQATAKSFPLIRCCCADVSTAEGRATITQCLSEVVAIEALVHNAGVIEPIKSLATLEEREWQEILSTNVNAPLFLTQALLTKLVNKRVLHVGSGAAYFPVHGWAGYCTSKAALAMLTRCWQLEQRDIFFTSVMPGIINTSMQEKIRLSTDMDPTKLEYFHHLHQKNHLISPTTVALFLRWLLTKVSNEEYVSRKWDIYDTQFHERWLDTGHHVPHWEIE